MSRRARLRLCSLLLGLAGCAAAPLGDRESAITNGTADDQDPAVVGLVIGGQIECTGTLIGPRVVITAAHCVIDGRPIDVLFGSSLAAGGTRIAAASREIHPGFVRATLENDLALLVLAASPPTAAHPIPLAPESDAPAVGMPLRLIGYGLTSAAAQDAGIKRTGTTAIDQLDEQELGFHAMPSQTCRGDSGGPALGVVAGSEVLMGVTSSGDDECQSFARSIRVDRQLASFIAPFLAMAAPSARAVGERCSYPENCRSNDCAIPAEPGFATCTAPCRTSSDCPTPMTCVPAAGGARCRYPSPAPGALGAACASERDCVSSLCVSPANGPGACSQVCFPLNPQPCPDDFTCGEDALTPTRFECLPRAKPAGCAVAGGTSSPRTPGGCPLALLLGVLALRRSRPGRR